jgi:hypothetical protein
MLAGVPSLREAGAHQLVLVDACELGLTMRQRQVVEEELEELFAAEREDEVVLALALVAGLPLPGPWPPPPPGRDAVARRTVVARVPLAHAALAVVELRLADVLAGMPIFSPLSRSRMLRSIASATAFASGS